MSTSPVIREQTAEDDARAMEIENAIFHDLPPTTVEEYRHRVSTLPPDAQRTAVVAERGGRIVGRAVWNRFLFAADRTAYRLLVAVDPPGQGHGIGSALYDAGMAGLAELGTKSVHGSVRETDRRARDFVAHRGFHEVAHGDRLSRLDVRAARLDTCRAADERVRASGVRLTPLAELGTDENLLHEIWAVERRTSRDIPGNLEWEGLSYEQWCDLVLRRPGARLDTIWIALDEGCPIGTTTLQLRAGNTADNSYTGVESAYRGKGIARALKLRAVEWACAHDITYIYTGNDPQNLPMLNINEEIGYEPLPAMIQVVREL